FGTVALSPDGKRLACVFTSYRQVPGKIEHEATRQIQLYDPATGKWGALPAEYKGRVGGPQVLFAPDGTLVILKDRECTIQELGKAKPRRTFKIVRGKGYEKHPVYSSYGVHDAVVSPDGSQLAIAAEGMLTVYDLTTGKELFRATRAVPEEKPGKGG